MDESCHTYQWVMSHISMSHVTRMNESCHTYEWVMSHIRMSHVTHTNESCHTYEWGMSHICKKPVIHIWKCHVKHHIRALELLLETMPTHTWMQHVDASRYTHRILCQHTYNCITWMSQPTHTPILSLTGYCHTHDTVTVSRPRMEKSHLKCHELFFFRGFSGLVRQKQGSLIWLHVKRGVCGVSSAVSQFLGGPSFGMSDSTCVCVCVCVCCAAAPWGVCVCGWGVCGHTHMFVFRSRWNGSSTHVDASFTTNGP